MQFGYCVIALCNMGHSTSWHRGMTFVEIWVLYYSYSISTFQEQSSNVPKSAAISHEFIAR